MSSYQILVDPSMYQAIGGSSEDDRRGVCYLPLKTTAMAVGCLLMVSSVCLALFKVGPASTHDDHSDNTWSQSKHFAMILLAVHLLQIPTALSLMIAVYKNARKVVLMWVYYEIFSTVFVVGINIWMMTSFHDNVANTVYFCFHSVYIIVVFCFTLTI